MAYTASGGVFLVLTPPLLVCAFVYNLVPPYNASPPPLWAEVLLYVWLCLTVGLTVVAAALLLQIRCPNCGNLLLRSVKLRESPLVAAIALVRVPFRRRICCGSCSHEYLLA